MDDRREACPAGLVSEMGGIAWRRRVVDTAADVENDDDGEQDVRKQNGLETERNPGSWTLGARLRISHE